MTRDMYLMETLKTKLKENGIHKNSGTKNYNELGKGYCPQRGWKDGK
jgi:hypothetical protein